MPATRGEFAPPSLRQAAVAQTYTAAVQPTRGEFAPPSLRRQCQRGGEQEPRPTRGEFAPPSLRQDGIGASRPGSLCYEGRIRPSLIAAPLTPVRSAGVVRLRGANSPLPHCGSNVSDWPGDGFLSTRGEFAPPSLRPGAGRPGKERAAAYEGRIRPSLIAAAVCRVHSVQ